MFLDSSLPVVDFSLADDAAAYDSIDLSSSFFQVINFIMEKFRDVLSFMDSVILFYDMTLLDLFIALTVMTVVIVAVFNIVRTGTINSISSVDRSRRSRSQKSDNSNRSDG